MTAAPASHDTLSRLSGSVRSKIEATRFRLRKLLLGVGPARELVRNDWPRSLSDPTGFYAAAFRHYGRLLPADIRSHRAYFTREQRGYGEDAFHVFWYLLFREFRCKTFLEIGVYRGQTLSLAASLQRRFGITPDVTGISPFTPLGDAVSRYRSDVDYFGDTLEAFRHFDLPRPNLVRALSTDPEAIRVIGSRTWDCIYIDGGHDYDVVKSDWDHAAAHVAPGGVIVMDDAALYTDFRPPLSPFKGHPGPSRVAEEVGGRFTEILRVGHNRAFQLRA